MLRLHILRTLLHKEMLRHLADRGGLVLSLLLLGVALLLSLGKTKQQASVLTGSLNRVYIAYEPGDPQAVPLRAWIEALKSQRDQTRREQPDETLCKSISFRTAEHLPKTEKGLFRLDSGEGLLLVRSDGTERFKVEYWYPGDDETVMAPYEAWFWQHSASHFKQTPAIVRDYRHIDGSADIRSQIAAALVLFALFFTCVYLLPSLTCEERERGVLLAQALSPASPLEILASKFLFYPVIGIALGGTIGAIYNPAVILMPYYWLVLIVTALGSLGIGLSIASLARTQRLASMGALCYMLVVALVLFICQQNGIGGLPLLALEYHAPRMIHSALAADNNPWRWVTLGGTAVLAGGWATLAVVLFRKRGWQ